MDKIKVNKSKNELINITKAMKIFDNDLELFLELINKFIIVYPEYLKEIYIALNKRDIKTLSEKLYKFKGMLLNLAIDKAEEYLIGIERFKENLDLNDAFDNYQKLELELKKLKNYVAKSGWDKLKDKIEGK